MNRTVILTRTPIKAESVGKPAGTFIQQETPLAWALRTGYAAKGTTIQNHPNWSALILAWIAAGGRAPHELLANDATRKRE